MNIFNSIKTGASLSLKNKKIIFLFFLCNLGFSLIVVLPTRSLIKKAVGHSLVSQELAGPFNFVAFVDFMHKYGTGISAIMNMFWFLASAYVIFNTFLLGGAINTFCWPDQNFTFNSFISRSAKFFSRFFKLLLISALCYVVIWLFNLILAKLIHTITGETIRESTSFVLWIIRNVFVLMIVLTVAMIFDYAKIETVLADKFKMFQTTFTSMRFAIKNFTKTFGLYVILFLLGLLFLWVYNLIADLFSSPSSMIIVLLIFWQQLYIFSKFWLKLTYYSSQINLYIGLTGASGEEPKVV